MKPSPNGAVKLNSYYSCKMNELLLFITAALLLNSSPYVSGQIAYVEKLMGNIGTAGSANGASTVATFYNPRGIAMDSQSNYYVADFSSHIIRKIDGSTLFV